MAEELSLAQLEALIEKRKRQLERLQERRKKLESLLEEVQLKIAAIEGRVQRGQRKATAARSGKPTAKKKRRRGAASKQPLDALDVSVLSDVPEGLPLKELEQAVLDRGYKTNSKNFRNVLYQAVYKLGRAGRVKRDTDSGRYKLVS